MSHAMRLATALSLMATIAACSSEKGEDPVGVFLSNIGASDPVPGLVGNGLAAPQNPPAAAEPDPVYVPPPLGCEPHRNWRYMVLDCLDRQIGTYGDE